MEGTETKLQKEIEILKRKIYYLKTKNEELDRKITGVLENHFHKVFTLMKFLKLLRQNS